jgi:hypothetical protein
MCLCTFQQFLKEMQTLSSPWPQDPRASCQIPLAVIETERKRELVKTQTHNEPRLLKKSGKGDQVL